MLPKTAPVTLVSMNSIKNASLLDDWLILPSLTHQLIRRLPALRLFSPSQVARLVFRRIGDLLRHACLLRRRLFVVSLLARTCGSLIPLTFLLLLLRPISLPSPRFLLQVFVPAAQLVICMDAPLPPEICMKSLSNYSRLETAPASRLVDRGGVRSSAPDLGDEGALNSCQAATPHLPDAAGWRAAP